MLDLEGVIAWTYGDAWERFTGPVGRLTPLIPEETLVGHHLCYGTFPRVADVRGARHEAAGPHGQPLGGRLRPPVDWLHLAGQRYLRSEDERFFRPLADLQPGDARVFPGIVLSLDCVSGLRRRHRTAPRYLDDLGVAMYCGFSRQPGKDGMETMREHSA